MNKSRTRFEVREAHDATFGWVIAFDSEVLAYSGRTFDTVDLAIADINDTVGHVSVAENADVVVRTRDGEQ